MLLDKNLNSGKDILHRLGQWGMTVGEIDPTQPNFQWPTILECDFVMIDSAVADSIICEQSAAKSESLAPLILLGVSGSLLLARDAWQVLPQTNPDSTKLRLAIQACLEQVSLMRHGPSAGQDREDFLSFLGHEMRSPLTAAKTALEVLQGDLGGINSQETSPDPNLKMLDIALRNVRRLHQTVEWSQELLASAPVEQNINLHDICAEELHGILESFPSTTWEGKARQLCVHTQGESLSTLMDQVTRAFQYAVPEFEPKLHLQSSQREPGALSLTLSSACGGVQDGAPRVSRLGLTSSESKDETVFSDLERLVRFVVSPTLISRLGVYIEVVENGEGEICIQVDVPGGQGAGVEADSVPQFLP